MKNCKNFWKRGISLALALMMCLSLLPVNAFAAEPPATITCGKLTCDKTAHYVAEVPATCQREGVVAHYECSSGHNTSLEGSYFRHEVTRIPRVSHNFNVKVSTTATCGKDGRATYKCEWCSRTTTKPDAATGEHSWSVWSPAADSKCSGTVEQIRECSVCHKTEKQTVAATGEHSFVGGDCQTKSTCEVCGAEGNFGEHDFSVFVSTTATCGAAGKDTYKCANCDATEERDADATGAHDFSVFVSTTATCGAAGKAIYKCANCDATEERDAEATGAHNWGEWTPAADSACEGTVAQTRECSECGATENRTVDATGNHTPGEPVEENKINATCGADGSYDEVVYCTECGAELSREHKTIAATGNHTYSRWSDSADKHCYGTTFDRTRTCTKCGHEDTQKGLAGTREHKLSDMELVGGVVWNDGSTFDTFAGASATVKCKNCNWTETVTFDTASSNTMVATKCGDQSIKRYKVYVQVTAPGKPKPFNLNARGYQSGPYYSDPLPHDLTAHEAVAATCTTPGNIAYWTCNRCGKFFSDAEGTTQIGATSVTIPATDHKWGPWMKQGTGGYRRTCENDPSHYETRADAPEHEHDSNVVLPAVPATCTTTGLTEGKACSFCGEVQVAQQVTPALSHDWSEWEITVEPTLTTAGKAMHSCNRCPVVEWKELPALTDSSVWTLASSQAATCTENGQEVYTSEYGTVTMTIEKLGHDWGDWTITTAPTATTEGEAKHDCKRDDCNASETVVLPVLTDDTWTWAFTGHKDATCTEAGQDVYVSEYGAVTVVIPELGHDWGDWTVTTDPTADAVGEATRTCKRCGGTDTKTLPALGGNGGGEVTNPEWTYAVTVEPGCTTDGLGTYTYTEDGSTVTVTIPATGHAWGDWTVALEPTYAAEGLEIRTCANCGETQTRVISALELPAGGLGGDTEEPEIEIEDEQTPLAGMPYALNPEDLLTRGHLMYVLHWFDGEPEAEISTFIDVALEAYYSVAIGWAQDENIARGTPDNKFMPEDTVTRGQMEVFLTRYAEYLGLDMEVVLVGDDSDLMFWAEAETILNEFFASLPVEA